MHLQSFQRVLEYIPGLIGALNLNLIEPHIKTHMRPTRPTGGSGSSSLVADVSDSPCFFPPSPIYSTLLPSTHVSSQDFMNPNGASSSLHSALRFMPGTFAWILEDGRKLN
ncbi:hypothetical protein EYF80_035473 [Liparis tanakae]|uniref:Uncharacterized protein n=1 Tax=Liparis tanakae TaxID=230148 RepID=A0A4Z2GNE8_9TELE|nr:hypothetical protein EYF80_035473 [Liparis tanakae]